MNKGENTITAINKSAVLRICSGQVVLNLATAVKELVENSLDAGATVIDVRLRGHGTELVEVSDNGSGVADSNFQGLTLKHHTSKLEDFSDLVSVETFGFRGEALSSLCALSDLEIVTRDATSPCGTKLVFDHAGTIVSATPCARQVGTTVSLQNLFATLPVRQKEFHRNVKREYAKMSQLLCAYCLVATGVKLTCVNQTKTGGRSTVVSTEGCKTMRENIACVFGTKQLSSLLAIEDRQPDTETLSELNLEPDTIPVFQLEGFISSCAHGQGRAAPDRQFYYINSRPCDPAKIVKTVHDIYHQFNPHQVPFVCLNICIARDCVDVNVTPDKRQIFLNHEKLLFVTLKASLLHLYEGIPSTFSMNNLPKHHFSVDSPSTQNEKPCDTPASLLSRWRHPADTKRQMQQDLPSKTPAKQRRLDTTFSTQLKVESVLVDIAAVENNLAKDEDIVQPIPFIASDIIKLGSEPHKMTKATEVTPIMKKSDYNSLHAVKEVSFDDKQESSSQITFSDYTNEQEIPISLVNSGNQSTSCPTPPSWHDRSCEAVLSSSSDVLEPMELLESTTSNFTMHESLYAPKRLTQPNRSGITVKVDSVVPNDIGRRRTIQVSLTIEMLQQMGERRLVASANSIGDGIPNVRFRAVIDPDENRQAESELNREITKDMFSQMTVIGQFNLGFIIARLKSDLFIVDQHATDEKYNFESLQRTTTLSNQKLVVPQQLELTAVNESLLMESIDVFRSNGFDFIIDETAPPTRKFKLCTIPMSKNWTFGKEDIDELLFMLQDSPQTFCRPSRMRAMFASRACRMSVMIGTALSPMEMGRLLAHMGEIDQPWNCPHGRPTMRHLINLDFVK